jgi:UDP-glucose 4-epimerase
MASARVVVYMSGIGRIHGAKHAMKAIVTGGAGFIGSHLVDRLLSDGHDVTVIDNMSCGHVENLGNHSGSPHLKIHQMDVRNPADLDRAIAGHDVVFHLAAQADIRKSLSDHRSDLEHNVVGTLNVLESMIKNGVQDLIFASTSALYGEATLMPTPENYCPLQTSLYGASKLASEAYAEAYTEFAPIRFWAFRFANVVGERCRRGVVWDFVHKLKKNRDELEILGDGKQSKEYLYVTDCVDGIITGYTKSRNKVNIFNLGLDEQTLVDRVTDIVIEEMGLRNVRRRYAGGERGWIGDNPRVILSIDKLKRLGWRANTTAETAIRRTVRWTVNNV